MENAACMIQIKCSLHVGTIRKNIKPMRDIASKWLFLITIIVGCCMQFYEANAALETCGIPSTHNDLLATEYVQWPT